MLYVCTIIECITNILATSISYCFPLIHNDVIFFNFLLMTLRRFISFHDSFMFDTCISLISILFLSRIVILWWTAWDQMYARERRERNLWGPYQVWRSEGSDFSTTENKCEFLFLCTYLDTWYFPWCTNTKLLRFYSTKHDAIKERVKKIDAMLFYRK